MGEEPTRGQQEPNDHLHAHHFHAHLFHAQEDVSVIYRILDVRLIDGSLENIHERSDDHHVLNIVLNHEHNDSDVELSSAVLPLSPPCAMIHKNRHIYIYIYIYIYILLVFHAGYGRRQTSFVTKSRLNGKNEKDPCRRIEELKFNVF
jgi:hypothetical protein